MAKVTEAQRKANKKWDNEHKKYTNYLRSRSSAKSFIKNKATKDDIKMLKEVMEKRLNDLT